MGGFASHSMQYPFVARDSPIQGKGAFATRFIKADERFAEYTGERISNAVAEERYDDEAMDRHHTFLFDLEDGTCLDGAVGGNESIYINHSCDPNCETEIDDGRVLIFALRDIQPGEELFYDYAYGREETGDDEELYPCRCGSAKCRGTILAEKEV